MYYQLQNLCLVVGTWKGKVDQAEEELCCDYEKDISVHGNVLPDFLGIEL